MSEVETLERGAVAAPCHHARVAEILTPEVLDLVAEVHRKFDARRRALVAERQERQKRYDAGELPDFDPETAHIRDAAWNVAPIPDDLRDRRVEITGPTNAKMVINALNSGAKVFMADFEDATAPAWETLIDGQANLKDRWRGALGFTDPDSGKTYALSPNPAVLLVRPRGLHLDEAYVTVDGQPVSGAFFDFVTYMVHNAVRSITAESGPYFYLPKLESHAEAVLWDDVICCVEDRIGLPRGTVKVTVLIETLPAAFCMEEILHALRQHIVGLNCGRWDYIFSYIKRLGQSGERIVPDRADMTMDKAFLAAYSLRLVDSCHKRGAFAMGGMSAFIPVKGDEAANEAAFAKVRADKEREVRNGHDGTWVAHPGLVATAMDAFAAMAGDNQLAKRPAEVPGRDAMLQVHDGQRTEEGARECIRVGVQYIAAWIGGRGAVPLYNLMEDAATAEICRALLWQWRKFGADLDDGRTFDAALCDQLFDEEIAKLPQNIPHLQEAAQLYRTMIAREKLDEFLTTEALPLLEKA